MNAILKAPSSYAPTHLAVILRHIRAVLESAERNIAGGKQGSGGGGRSVGGPRSASAELFIQNSLLTSIVRQRQCM